MPAVKITQKPIGIPGDDTHFLVTQPELPKGYTPTGQETEEELAELKVESVREIEMDDMVELIQDKLDMDVTPTTGSSKPVTSGGIKAALDLMDDDISSLNEDLNDLQELAETKAAAIYETASGEITSFSDGADDMPMKSCVVKMEPIQEGEGDPSPENVRPITGRTGINVVRTGKNLLPANSFTSTTKQGLTYTVNDDGTVSVSGTATASSYITYDVTFPVDVIINGVPEIDGVVIDGTSIQIYSIEPGIGTTVRANNNTFVLLANYPVQLRLRINSNVTVDNAVFKPMARLATDTDYSFEPYKGNAYSVNWETEAGTVYGGTLDVVSGKLMVDRAKTTLDGTNTVANVVVKDGFTNCRISGYTPVAKNYATPTTHPKAVCSDAKVIDVYYAWQNQDIPTANSFTVNGSYIGMSIPGSFADADAIKAYLATHNVDVCYEITTPTEIQLTQQEVRTLLGVNNIWSDGGDMAAEYPADTKMYIDRKITEAIAAALA